MSTVLAYLDPGSGSMILQIIAGGLAAVAVTAKLYWNRILRFLRIRKDEPEAATPADAREYRLGLEGRAAASRPRARRGRARFPSTTVSGRLAAFSLS